MTKFSLTQLQEIDKRLNKPPNRRQAKEFEAFLAYNPREQEQFIVDQLRVELISRFHNREVPMPEEGELAYRGKPLKYLNYDEIHRYLKERKKDVKAPKEGRRNEKGRFKAQEGGQNDDEDVLAAIDDELERRRKALERFNKNNKNKNNVEDEIVFNVKQVNNNYKKIENKLNKMPKELVSVKIKETTEVVDKPNKKPEPNFNKRRVNNNANKKPNKPTNKKFNKPANKKPNNKARKNESRGEKEFIHYNDRFMTAMKESFPDCEPSGEKPCRLTKKQLCKKIVQHFMIRVNLIAAIVSVLPKRGKDGYYGGFCYQRYLALRDGKLCLPPNYEHLDSMNTKKQLKVLAKYINNFSEKDCNNVQGYWKELNKGELASLRVNEGNFNRYYLDYTARLQRQYQESILQLLGVLKKLDETPMIDNATLNALTEKAKDTIDNLYQSCHRSYTYAMFAFVRADLETTPRQLRQEEEDLEVLQKGMNQ